MNILISALLLLACYCAQAKPLRIGMPLGKSTLTTNLQLQLTTAYQALELTPEFIALPSERRLRLLQNGELDADLFRICDIETQYNDLLIIPVPLQHLTLNAYSLDPAKLVNWQQEPRYLISHIRGFKMAEQQEFAGKRISVNSDEQAFGLMLQGRADIVLEDSFTAETFLREHDVLTNITQQEVQRFDVCHVLHNRWQHLLPPLTEQLTAIVADSLQ